MFEPQESLKTFHFRVRSSLKSPTSDMFGSTCLNLPVRASDIIREHAYAVRLSRPTQKKTVQALKGKQLHTSGLSRPASIRRPTNINY